MDWGYIDKRYVYNTKIGFIIENPKMEKNDLQSRVEHFTKDILENRHVQNVLIDLNGTLSCDEIKIFYNDFMFCLKEVCNKKIYVRVENYYSQTHLINFLDEINIILEKLGIECYFFLEISHKSVFNEKLLKGLKLRHIVVGITDLLDIRMIEQLKTHNLICVPIVNKGFFPKFSENNICLKKNLIIYRNNDIQALNLIQENFTRKVLQNNIYSIQTIVWNSKGITCFSIDNKILEKQYTECEKCSLSGCCTETIHRICKGNNERLINEFQSWILDKVAKK